jgi:hypothetical protein
MVEPSGRIIVTRKSGPEALCNTKPSAKSIFSTFVTRPRKAFNFLNLGIAISRDEHDTPSVIKERSRMAIKGFMNRIFTRREFIDYQMLTFGLCWDEK